MAVVRQKMIFRTDLQANPDVLYLFGDNVERVGLGGQAKEMRHEPNAVGIVTKWRPDMKDSSFFSDDQFEIIRPIILNDFSRPKKHLSLGGTVIIPSDGLGTGLARLDEVAPRCFAYLNELIKCLKSEN